MKLVSNIEHKISKRFTLKQREVLVIKDFIPGKPVEFEDGAVENWGANLLRTYPQKYSVFEEEGNVITEPVEGMNSEAPLPPDKEELEAKTVPQLREIANQLAIDKTFKIKADLIQAILDKVK